MAHCLCDAAWTSAVGQNPNLPHRNNNGRFTSISSITNAQITGGVQVFHIPL
jgi:hypothetical protein